MEKINFENIDKHLSSDGNSLIINYLDLVELINRGLLTLSTKSGNEICLISDLNIRIPNGIALLDSGWDNYGENTKEIILPL